MPRRRALVAGLGRAPVVRPLGGITERRAGPGAHVTWEGSAPLGLITDPPFCRDSTDRLDTALAAMAQALSGRVSAVSEADA